jgi:transcriptional regulator with XRE-family HTH domain
MRTPVRTGTSPICTWIVQAGQFCTIHVQNLHGRSREQAVGAGFGRSCTPRVQPGHRHRCPPCAEISASRAGHASLHGVAAIERRLELAALRGRRALQDMGEELRRARVAAGLSQTAAGLAAGMSHTSVSRIEHGRAGAVSVEDLFRLGAVLGLDLSLRAYPGPQPIRDAAHLLLLERFRCRLAPGLGWQTEVPLPNLHDRRAWDAVVSGAGPLIGVEAETRLRDAQAVARRIALKQRDSGIERAVLLLSASRTNREVLRAIGRSLDGSFPVPGARILDALARGDDPGGSGIVLL